MKINKTLNEKLNKTLIEAEEVGGVEVTEKGAEADVKLTKDDKPATKKDALKITNALTMVLDRALDSAEYALEEKNYDANCNVLVTGLPGSSKTATIRNWCKQNNCNMYYLDAKNPDLQLLTSGAASIDRTDPKNPEVDTAYSRALDKLDRERSVLFLDELNRQVREYMRGSLLTLIADRRVAGRDEDGFRYFPNLLFTVAAINPAKEDDKGATELNDAEDRRFYYHTIFNSEVPTSIEFITQYYNEKLEEYAADHDVKDPAVIKRLNSFCLRQWIGNKILRDPKFHYTEIDEYMAKTEKGQITCQSTITELIDHSRGELDRLMYDINASGLTDSAKAMLISIIDTLILPNPDALRMKKATELGIDLGPESPDAAKEPAEVETDTEDDLDFSDSDLEGDEDDLEFSSSVRPKKPAAPATDKRTAAKTSDAAIKSILSGAVSSWRH